MFSGGIKREHGAVMGLEKWLFTIFVSFSMVGKFSCYILMNYFIGSADT